MKNKFILAILLVFFVISVGCFSSCDIEKQKDEEVQEIQLTMENYKYYLTITRQFMYKSTYDYVYMVNISGAVSGIYENCILYTKGGTTIKLNAAGNGQCEGKFDVEKVEGKIILSK